jgi:hypothetical protein
MSFLVILKMEKIRKPLSSNNHFMVNVISKLLIVSIFLLKLSKNIDLFLMIKIPFIKLLKY